MDEKRHYHFIGIGGAGMSGLARVLHSHGYCITGSDSVQSETLLALENELGVALQIGNSAENITQSKPDVVVTTAALSPDNPELVAAQNSGMKIISRADLLAQTMELFKTKIAITGTHGKTTTTAMAAIAIQHADLRPTTLVGADVPLWHSNTLIGTGNTIIAESCEAFGSFLSIYPTHTIITNIEADHLDYYKTFDAVVSAFRQFVKQTSDIVVCCAENGASNLIKDAAGSKLITYGLRSGDFLAEVNKDGSFDVFHKSSKLGSVSLKVPGTHNILNALSVIALGMTLDVNFKTLSEGLAQFTGTSRRFELLGEIDGATIIDDYAHHPTEIRATLSAAKQRYPDRRIVALFQPHLPSRTMQLMDEFASAFNDADEALITDIYLAREKSIDGVSSQALTVKIAEQLGTDKVSYVGDLDHASAALRDEIKSGDVVLTLGAGSVRKAGMALLEAKL